MRGKLKLLQIGFVIGLTLLGVFFFLPHKASAATFTVDSIADDIDDNAGDGNCDNGSGDCTLRAAIEEANALSGADAVQFSIAGAGVKTISPLTAFPQILERLDIDGTTQPGSACGALVPSTMPGNSSPHTLLIQISGADMSPSSNLLDYRQDESSGSILRGLVLNNLVDSVRAIDIENGADDITIECNYIGSNVAGDTNMAVADDSNNALGILINSATNTTVQNNLIVGWAVGINTGSPGTIRNNLIGTTASGITAISNKKGIQASTNSEHIVVEHNIISGNEQTGIDASDYVKVLDNFIGLNVQGNPLGNGTDGIYISNGSTATSVGSSSSKNIISANMGSGIHIERDSDCEDNIIGASILGNYIGTNASGNVATGYGNQDDGITINEAQSDCGGSVYNHTIGGDAAGEKNIIAGNARDGVRIYSVPWETCDDDGDGEDPPYLCDGTDVFSISILSNRIYQNDGLNIDLATDADNDGLADSDIGQNPLNSFLIDYPATHANNFLNSPVINLAQKSGTQLIINYDYTAQSVSAENPDDIAQSDLLGYRLDFYVNGKDHLGSFMIDGSADNASHTFSYSGEATNVSATATILWKTYSPPECESGHRSGDGPPYTESVECE